MAYGARLESVLGASPRGFESPILRHRTPGPLQVPGFLLPVAPLVFQAPLVFRAPLVFWAPSGPAAREIATREPAARKCRSRSPPVPSGPSGALHTGGTCGAWTSPARPRRRPPAPWPGHAVLAAKPRGSVVAGNRAVTALLSPGLVPLRLRGLRRSLRPGVQPGPRPSQRASIDAGPSRCSSIRPSMPSR